MNSPNKFQKIEHEGSQAVVSFSNGTTFKINRLMERINYFFSQSVLRTLSEQLNKFGLGSAPNCGGWNNSVEAEILEPESGKWRTGKMRMRVILEFCPDEPE